MIAPPPPRSPRIARLGRDVAGGRTAALEAFWRQVETEGTPLVEAAEGGEAHVLVTLLWRGDDDTRNVVAETPFDTGDPADCQMTRLPGTDVWYRTFESRSDLRFSYRLSPNDPLTPWSQAVPWAQRVATWRLDPLNPNHPLTFPKDDEAPPGDTRGAAWAHSTAELPAARRNPYRRLRDHASAGRVHLERIPSERLLPCHWLEPPRRATRRAWVYTPPGYSSDGDGYDLVLLFDGYDYVHYFDVQTLLDNVLAEGRLRPLVAVMLDTPNTLRGRELMCSSQFADALAEDVLPWVRRRYHVTTRPGRAVVGGFSAGGLAAANAGLRHPNLFGNVLSQSGAFWWTPSDELEPEWLARQFAAQPRLPLRFHLDVGQLETWASRSGGPSQLLANRHLRTVLQARDYPVHYAEFGGGHSFFCWQLTLIDGLLALLGQDPAL